MKDEVALRGCFGEYPAAINPDSFKPKTVHVVYIVASVEKVWAALTTGDMTRQYFFGRSIEIDLQPGGAFRFWQPDGTLDVEGRVVECDPLRRLAVTWRVMWIEAMRKLPKCLVTYQRDALGEVVRLTMTEAHQIELDDALLEGGRRGWPVILNNLKTLLETGHPMPPFDFMSGAAVDTMKQASQQITGAAE